MKTYKHLYPRVWNWENLYQAYRRARRGKRGKVPVADFEFFLEDNLVQLQEELRTQTYRPGPYYSFYIHEPKRRLISAAPFRDRVVHHALCQIIEPIFERRFIHDCYANRVGKGTHRALDRCTCRNRNEPDNWNNNIGFRVVVAHGLLRPEMPHGRPQRSTGSRRSWAAEASKSGATCSRPPDLRFRRANTEKPCPFW